MKSRQKKELGNSLIHLPISSENLTVNEWKERILHFKKSFNE